MLSDKEMRERMVNGWRGGLHEGTPCGLSSTWGNSRNVRAWLPDIASRYGIESINDAGAGDLHWIKHVDWDVKYRPFDLFPRAEGVTELDITTEVMPEADAILCRMVLNHLDHDRISMALDNFWNSARFLIATHFDTNAPNRNREFTRLDLTEWLGEPVEQVDDGHEEGCYLALWDME